jgi:hypothetical protein
MFNPRSGHVGYVVDKVALGQVFSQYFSFPCQFSFHRLLHTHLSSGAGTICQFVADIPSGFSLTPPQVIKKNWGNRQKSHRLTPSTSPASCYASPSIILPCIPLQTSSHSVHTHIVSDDLHWLACQKRWRTTGQYAAQTGHCSISTLGSHLGGAWFEFWMRHQLPYWDSSVIRPLPLPSRSFLLHQSSYHLLLHSLDTDSVIKYHTQKSGGQTLHIQGWARLHYPCKQIDCCLSTPLVGEYLTVKSMWLVKLVLRKLTFSIWTP